MNTHLAIALFAITIGTYGVARGMWRLRDNRFVGRLLCACGVLALAAGSFGLHYEGRNSFASQLVKGEVAVVLAIISASDAPDFRYSIYKVRYEVPKDYRWLLILKNKAGKERREFWDKPDTVRVGDNIGRLESGLILVQTANTGSESLATR